MSQSTYSVHRATIDDLPGMLALWQAMHCDNSDLERRLTEFQLIVAHDGTLLGALGLSIVERQGWLHTEAFYDFALADVMRGHLWERIQSVATSHGLARLWTNESAPFWKQHGFTVTRADTLKKLPAAWVTQPGDWLTLQLRDEEALRLSLEAEFGRFKEAEKRRMEQVLYRARLWKYFGILVVGCIIATVFYFCFFLIRNGSSLMRR